MDQRIVRQAVADYLQVLESWQCYATLTFCPIEKWWLSPSAKRDAAIGRGQLRADDGDVRHKEHVVFQTNHAKTQKAVARFHDSMNRRYFGPRYRRLRDAPLVRMFAPWERHKSGQFHLHPLVGRLPEGWRFNELHEDWHIAQCEVGLKPGRAWLKKYSDEEKLRRYVAKYVCKDLDGDTWDLYGFDQGHRR